MKIVCFGEIMMRLNPEGYQRFVQAERYEASYAGGEANVAVSLANYGLEASFVTKLPANPIGEAARNAVRHYGVDTKDIVWGGPRLVEKGVSQRASKVVYDRAGSRNACRRKRHRPRPEIIVFGNFAGRFQVEFERGLPDRVRKVSWWYFGLQSAIIRVVYEERRRRLPSAWLKRRQMPLTARLRELCSAMTRLVIPSYA